MASLKEKIENRQAKVAVVGLGYVGIPVAALFAKAGFQVLGVDIQPEKVALLNRGLSSIEGREPGLAELIAKVAGKNFAATTDYPLLKGADVITISVETPVDEETKLPRYVALRSAVKSIGENLKKGAMVIVESTIAPRTMADVVLPILEEASGLKVNEGFLLVHCPERVMPGKLIQNIQTCDRVIGASSPEAGEAAKALYSTIVNANLDVTDLLTAEVVKTAENTYRDVQIAFANELALICESLGADFWKVRDLVNKSPGRDVHQAGAGVGGHCIPKDSWLLISPLKGKIETRIIPNARHINDSMPRHVFNLLLDGLELAGVSGPDVVRVAVLGYAYLANSDDTRNSPSAELVRILREAGYDVVIHDPYVKEYQGNLLDAVEGADAVIVMVAHDEYLQADWEEIWWEMHGNLLVDGRNVLGKEKAEWFGFTYKAVGVGD